MLLAVMLDVVLTDMGDALHEDLIFYAIIDIRGINSNPFQD